MFKLSFISTLLLVTVQLSGQSPHGKSLTVSCQTCHTTENWKYKEKGFDHNTTAFKLTGQHKDVSCKKCHPTLVFSNATSECASCHKDVHESTLGKECDRCHTTSSWIVASVSDIHRRTGFPLEGSHKGLDCNECHKSGSRLRFEPMNTACVSCHLKDYIATTNPSHPAAKFATTCETCHDEVDWNNATFDHNTATSFPLKGAHQTLQCSQCHTQGYDGTNTACVSCHLKDYNATTNPSHAAAKFATTCETCHDETDWNNGTFDHNTATSFPLKGAHQTLQCSQCHTQVYDGTNTACVSCHLKDYNAATNPSHATAKFPTTCETCHSATAWSPSTFNHDNSYFPIYSGKHQGEWTTCSQCHTNSSNFSVFSCLTCHEHNKTSMDEEHRGVRNYVYNSTNCLSCHPRGNSD